MDINKLFSNTLVDIRTVEMETGYERGLISRLIENNLFPRPIIIDVNIRIPIEGYSSAHTNVLNHTIERWDYSSILEFVGLIKTSGGWEEYDAIINDYHSNSVNLYGTGEDNDPM